MKYVFEKIEAEKLKRR